MADIQDSGWSEVADQNSATAPNGFPEGMNRRDVNNAAREFMGAVKRMYNRAFATRAATHAVDTYTVSYTVNPLALTQGLTIAFRADADCAANAKLKVGSLTSANLRKQTGAGLTALASRDVRAGQIVVAVYDTQAAAFIVTNTIAGSGDTADYGDLKVTARVGGWTDRGWPSGWIFCDGRHLSRTTYAGLFAAIGTQYGAGDGTTTFAIPDCRGRALAGADRFLLFHHHENQAVGGRITGNPMPGAVMGSEGVTLTPAQIPSHTHSGTTGTAGAHGHTGTTSGVGDHAHTGATDAAGFHQHSGTTNVSGEHAHSLPNLITGAGFGGFGFAGSNNWGPVDWTVTTPSGNHQHTFATDGAGQHTHNISTHGAGAHSHDLFINVNGDHTHSLTINATGGGQSHSVMQPTAFFNVLIYTGVNA